MGWGYGYCKHAYRKTFAFAQIKCLFSISDSFDLVLFCDSYRTNEVGSAASPRRRARRGEETEAAKSNSGRDSGGVKTHVSRKFLENER